MSAFAKAVTKSRQPTKEFLYELRLGRLNCCVVGDGSVGIRGERDLCIRKGLISKLDRWGNMVSIAEMRRSWGYRIGWIDPHGSILTGRCWHSATARDIPLTFYNLLWVITHWKILCILPCFTSSSYLHLALRVALLCTFSLCHNLRTSGKTEEEEVRILEKGDYFGEQALLKEECRSANVIALPPGVECLTLGRE